MTLPINEGSPTVAGALLVYAPTVLLCTVGAVAFAATVRDREHHR